MSTLELSETCAACAPTFNTRHSLYTFGRAGADMAALVKTVASTCAIE